MEEHKIQLIESIESKIFLIRGCRVLLDVELARIYGVETKRLKEQVRRNLDRFPADFMFELTEDEFSNLRSHFATSSHGGSRYLPFAFTEHGAVMLASVLNSEMAIKMSIEVVRAFIKLREILMVHKDLAFKIENLESKYDAQFKTVFNAIKQLMYQKDEDRVPIGYKISNKKTR